MFRLKIQKKIKRRPYHLKNDLSHELPLRLILIRMATFESNILIPSSKDDQKMPKTTENLQNYQKTPIRYLKNSLLYELLLPLILIRMATFESNILILSSKDDQKTPKTGKRRKYLKKYLSIVWT